MRIDLKLILITGAIILSAAITTTTIVSSYADNPAINQYIELGHRLFFDKNLSFNQTKSCASCHDPKMAFTDGYRRSLGATADLHLRNSSTLLNISKNKYFTAADPFLNNLADQLKGPLFNSNFIELGLAGHEKEVLQTLNEMDRYQEICNKLNKDPKCLSFDLIIKSLVMYLEQLNSKNSKYDLYLAGKVTLTEAEKRGMQLFFSDNLACASCHGGEYFNQPKDLNETFTRNGFWQMTESVVEKDAREDRGVFLITHKDEDIGEFRIPTLRNVTLTGPYMHDGGVATLEAVIHGYAKGGKNKVGISPIIKGFTISKDETRDLLLFLKTLEDLSYLDSPLFVEPEN